MEKPDDNGFVNITWPSKNVPHGGIFHTAIVKPSSERQQFLKVLLEESKLAIGQRLKTGWEGALRQEAEKEEKPRRYMPLVRPRTSRRRSLSEIRQSGVFELDDYRPIERGEDREKLKERLANTMAYGDKPQRVSPPVSLLIKPEPKLPTAKQKKHELLTQIRERAEWLAEMEDLGQAAPHRDIIKDQIAERLRTLQALGIDSECFSPRSSDSVFSTLRSRENIPLKQNSTSQCNSVRSIESAAYSSHSDSKGQQKSQAEHKPTRRSPKTRKGGSVKREENVVAYNSLPPLEYSARRRM